MYTVENISNVSLFCLPEMYVDMLSMYAFENEW